MKIQTITKGLGALLLILSASAIAAKYPACEPIAQACKAAGFVKGGSNKGRGLYKNCLKPLLLHQAPTPNSPPLPSVTSSQIAACNAQRA